MGLNRTEYADENSPIEFGKWHEGYEKCLEMADTNNIPMIAYWTPGAGCGYCETMEKTCFRNNVFKKWQESSKFIWCYVEGKNNPNKANVRGSTISEYPYIQLHWKLKNGLEINCHFSGRNTTIPAEYTGFPNNQALIGRLINAITSLFGCYQPK